MQGSTWGGTVNAGENIPGQRRQGMQGSTFQGEGGMGNAEKYLPEKGRDGKCRVEPSRKRETSSKQSSAFQGKEGMVNAG